jgi:hypothetical protein
MRGEAWLFLLCVGIAWLIVRPRGSGGAATGRMVRVHGHGNDRATIATHEAGHAVAARALGGKVRSATMSNSGGLVRVTLPTSSSKAAITFWAAGSTAAGTRHGADADEAYIRRELRTLPRDQRKQVEREARRDAARIVSQHSAQIRRDADRLNQRGRL